jgi:hypothetical protein
MPSIIALHATSEAETRKRKDEACGDRDSCGELFAMLNLESYGEGYQRMHVLNVMILE